MYNAYYYCYIHNGRESATACKPITAVPKLKRQKQWNSFYTQHDNDVVRLYAQNITLRTYSFITTRMIDIITQV